MRWRAITLLVVVLLLAAPACSRGGKGDDGFRLELEGKARIGDETVDDGGHRVEVGDTITMLEGDAVLELPGDRSVLLRAGDDERDATVVKVASAPDIVAGDAVVVAGDDARFTVGDVEVGLASGAARVRRGLSVTVGIYRGSADVRSAGRSFDGGLQALRQLSIAATGLLPREADPLVYDDKDPDAWDQRFIGDAIDLGTELDIRARGFTGQVGPRARADADLLRRVLPLLEDEGALGDLVTEDRSPGESLVGASIVVESAQGPFAARWADVFSFREAGARWGLVALDQRVKRDALLARINDALGRAPLLFAAGPSSAGSGGATTTTPAPGPGEGSTTTTTTTTTTTVGGGDDPPITIPPVTVPPTTVPGAPAEDRSDEPDEQSSVVDAILDSLGALLGGDPSAPSRED